KRFEMKGMMKFDKANDQIEIVPPIWDNISNKIRRVVASYCDAQLLRYALLEDFSISGDCHHLPRDEFAAVTECCFRFAL
ncbi:hypothetical protein, partial [Salmonella enterica]|uniref:hypothetical protein n=1 Tax=Salmonella enterica TaxID=28901 RepID=UPI003CEE9FCB